MSPEYPAKTIPIGLRGADVHVYKTSARFKVLTMQWTSFVAHQLGSLLSRFCTFTIPYNLMSSATLNEALVVIAWSLQACFTGCWPLLTHGGNIPKGKHFERRGELFVNGFHLALCQIRGDMKFLKELFSFKSSYQHNNCCRRCPASKVNP